MFSNSISKMLQGASFTSAQQRVSQIENQIVETTKQLESLKTQAPSKFAEILNQPPTVPLKYKLADPQKVSRAELQNIVNKVAEKYQVNEKLVTAIIRQESGFNPNAVSKAGAMGLMQLMPGTAKKLGVLNPFSPVQNVEGGVRYIKQMLDKYQGNVILALAAYNAGPGNVDKYGGVPPFKETQNYVKSILSHIL
ncbi:MAG TPA: lytic transglycosylase domain-containing protein [Candidatus Gastranaerophilales bacterium]|nr:lytic transglycosylase domain-containing protein [Candidatus Gastranaerophilales bacterium]